jgi:hypothetical protein
VLTTTEPDAERFHRTPLRVQAGPRPSFSASIVLGLAHMRKTGAEWSSRTLILSVLWAMTSCAQHESRSQCRGSRTLPA